MDIFNFLKSVNKVAIAAFFLTGSILLYEIYLFLKQAGGRRAPKIPELQKVNLTGLQKTSTIVKKKESKNPIFKPSSPVIIVILVIMVIVLAGAFGAAGLWKNVPLVNRPAPTPKPYFQIVKSEGIKIYNEMWQELTKNKLRYFRAGDTITIAVKNIAGTDISKARIRINAKTWETKHETTVLNQKLDVFYQTYQIASADAALKIEAQLYSQKDGWLGE